MGPRIWAWKPGRWLKVRANGLVGYVTRTTISGSDPAPAAAATGGSWSAARDGNTTELFVEVVAPSALLRAPSRGAPKLVDVEPHAKLAVVDAASMPGWIRARDEGGRDGWIARAAVDNGAASETVDVGTLREVTIANPERAYTRPPRAGVALRLDAAVAYHSLAMTMTANQTGGGVQR